MFLNEYCSHWLEYFIWIQSFRKVQFENNKIKTLERVAFSAICIRAGWKLKSFFLIEGHVDYLEIHKDKLRCKCISSLSWKMKWAFGRQKWVLFKLAWIFYLNTIASRIFETIRSKILCSKYRTSAKERIQGQNPRIPERLELFPGLQ